MDYLQKLDYHYRPAKGWVNDPNGLVCFKGYYHLFYQHAPDHEVPWRQPMHWGHARTKDFLNWEELPVALYPETEYDENGCWSGTAIVHDDVLYLFYASVKGRDKEQIQSVSVAYSNDGINFEKYAGNPVIPHFPPEGSKDFRDPAVCRVGDEFYCVMASGNPIDRMARLLLYKSKDLFNWQYLGVSAEWAEGKWTECPSIINNGGDFLLAASVQPLESNHYFQVIYGNFEGEKFIPTLSATPDKGPDQYAGQIFKDHLGRNLLISWIPGWRYKGLAEKDVGCFSLPREITVRDRKVYAYPIKELEHLLKDEDECLKRTEKGFEVARSGRPSLVYEGEITDLKIMRDRYIAEIFVNGGQEVYTVLL